MPRSSHVSVEGHTLRISNIVRISAEPYTKRIEDGEVVLSPRDMRLTDNNQSLFEMGLDLVNFLVGDKPIGEQLQEQQELAQKARARGHGSWFELDHLNGVKYLKFQCTIATRYVVIVRGSRPVFLYEQESHDRVKDALENRK